MRARSLLLSFISTRTKGLVHRRIITSPLLHLNRSLHESPHPTPPSLPSTVPHSQILEPVGFTPCPTEPDRSVNDETDDLLSEFLSRLVFSLRPKLSAAFPSLPKHSLDAMLLLICQRVANEIDGHGSSTSSLPPIDLSPDLWDTIKSESAAIQEAMRKERLREEVKKYLHCDEVKQMCRFAADVGIRCDLLRQFRFKWAKEKLDEVEFYWELDRIRMEAKLAEEGEQRDDSSSSKTDGIGIDALPQRKGKITYKIYGLDLSGPEWAEISERLEEAERRFVPEEVKPVVGRSKKVDDKILGMSENDDLEPALKQWKELMEPKKVDWLALLERIKEKNLNLYFKVAELILSEESFEANTRDYSRFIDLYTKADRIEDAERILHIMTERRISRDILTSISLVHMYSKAGNLDGAAKEYESLKKEGFQPDVKLYNSMIMAYVMAGKPKLGELLIRDMEASDIKPTKEMYMELLQAFAEGGDVVGAQRIVTTMQFAGMQPNLETTTLLIEAYAQADDPDQARGHFDHMIKAGHKPDDRCTASMIKAYVKKNLLDKALDLLLTLEKDAFQPGIRTNTVLVDWMGRLQLVDEAERILRNITDKGDPPFEVHVSLCDMYSRTKQEEKVRRSLKILEARKELLRADQFERIISGLLAGGFVADAKRIFDAMQTQGYTPTEAIRIAIMAAQSIPRQRSARRGGR